MTATVVCWAPFFLSSLGRFSINFKIQLSVAMVLAIMFLVGVFLGKVSGGSMFVHGVKALLGGLILTFVFLALKSDHIGCMPSPDFGAN